VKPVETRAVSKKRDDESALSSIQWRRLLKTRGAWKVIEMKVELKTLPKVSLDSLSHAGKVDGPLGWWTCRRWAAVRSKSVGGGRTKTETLVSVYNPYNLSFPEDYLKFRLPESHNVYRHSHNAKTIYIDLV